MTKNLNPRALALLTRRGVLTLAHSNIWDAGDNAQPCPTGCIGHYTAGGPFFPEATSEDSVRAAADGDLGPVAVLQSAEDAYPAAPGKSKATSRVRIILVEDIFTFAGPHDAIKEPEVIYLVDVQPAFHDRVVFAFKTEHHALELFRHHQEDLTDE